MQKFYTDVDVLMQDLAASVTAPGENERTEHCEASQGLVSADPLAFSARTPPNSLTGLAS